MIGEKKVREEVKKVSVCEAERERGRVDGEADGRKTIIKMLSKENVKKWT